MSVDSPGGYHAIRRRVKVVPRSGNSFGGTAASGENWVKRGSAFSLIPGVARKDLSVPIDRIVDPEPFDRAALERATGLAAIDAGGLVFAEINGGSA